jgi:hypothetical protein
MTINGKSYTEYNIEPFVKIYQTPETIWSFLTDVENWWVYSNPEHSLLKIESSKKKLNIGTEISIKEKIAGIPCEAKGEITDIKENKLLQWKAIYHVLGLNWLKINAGVNWKVDKINDAKTRLAANVWASFPDKLRYKLLWFLFKNVFNGVKKDYDHALTELEYIKTNLEG